MQNLRFYDAQVAKGFDLMKNEVEKSFEPNSDSIGLNQSSSKIKNNLTDCLMRFLFFSRATFFRRCLQRIILVLIIFAIPQIGCASDKPTEPDRLPWDVFPMNNDVKWVETGHYMLEGFKDEGTKYIIEFRYDTSTFFVRLITENQAELYATGIVKLEREGWEFIDGGMKELKFEDSVWTYGPTLQGHIHLENKKVYYQQTDKEKELLYDFGLRLNDTTTFGRPYDTAGEYFVASIDSAKLGNEYRKRYRFKSVYGNWFFSVIEGMGCDICFFYPLLGPIERNHNKDRLRGVYYKDKLIWGYDILGNKGE